MRPLRALETTERSLLKTGTPFLLERQHLLDHKTHLTGMVAHGLLALQDTYFKRSFFASRTVFSKLELQNSSRPAPTQNEPQR